MSWLFSRALVEAFSAATCSDGEPSAQLNVMPTQHKFWRNDKTMEPSQLSRFGLTCAVLTDERGAALLTWCRAGFHAKTFQQPAKEPGSTARNPGSGEKWRGSWVKFDPVTCSWKTAQFSLLGDLVPFSGTWPRSGLMRDGECYPLPNAEPLTSGSGSGFWPTPCTPNGGRVNKATDIATKGSRPDGRKVQISLESAAKSWSTPLANDAEKRGDFDATNPRNGLAGQAKAWGTPTAQDHKDSGDCSNVPENGLLGRMAKSFSGMTERPGSLSPEFHLWLQGWPTGWTALEPLETGKYRLWRQRHGIS
jgi:hypothetical protein